MADRILVIGLNYAPDQTGIPPYTTGAAEGLLGLGHEVRVITGYPHYPKWEIPADYTGLTRRETINGVPVLRLRHPVPANGAPLPRALMELVFGMRAALSRWGRPSVVVAISPALLSTALVVARARLTRIPVVVWVQDIYTLGVAQTGTGDLAARLGGEEFAILLPTTGLVPAALVAERIRRATEWRPLGVSVPVPMTVSVGVASTENRPAPLTATELLRQADAALYLAKGEGRNRVVSG